jgi:hypothetical protein
MPGRVDLSGNIDAERISGNNQGLLGSYDRPVNRILGEDRERDCKHCSQRKPNRRAG